MGRPHTRSTNPQVDRLLGRLEGVEDHSDYWKALCPVHDDHNPSLSISIGNDGKVLVKCHAEQGCTFEKIYDAVGLDPKDAFPDQANGRAKVARLRPRSRLGEIVAEYDYVDERGELLSQAVRYRPKDFRQRRPDETKRDGWSWDLEGVRRVPYGLPELKAADPAELVLVLEGEEDVHRAREMGLLATTNAGGAGKWGRQESEHLVGRDVATIGDNDPAGERHAEKAARALHAAGASSVKVVRLPGIPEGGGDFRDFADAGGTAEDVRRLVAEAPEWVPAKLEEHEELPVIVVNNRHLRDVTADALDAMTRRNDPPEVFVRAGSLVRVREDENGIPEIQPMELGAVRGRLARVADFERNTAQGETRVNPPEVVVKDILTLDRWPFPALEAVVETPILRPDGTIFDTPGYDPETRLYYRPPSGFELPAIPRNPTRQEIAAALDLINEAVGEFPYADEASAANTLGLMLTPVVRQAIDGPAPMALIDKPQAGTGGSLLAETVAVIGSGRTAEMLGAPRDDEEWRKQITAKLVAGGTMVTVDNVEGALYAPSLARALTARTWTDRVLGRSETATVSQRATWIATGNNIVLRGDLPRRCYWIRLDAKESRPWQRQNFRHPDLLSWVTANRPRLVNALLIIARAWFAAGKPKAEGIPRLGSFETWTEIVGGMVAFAGIPGFLGNLGDLYDKADEGGAEWEVFLETWHRRHGEDPIAVKDLTTLIKKDDSLRGTLPGDLLEALDKSEGGFTRRLGNALAKRAGTRFGEDGLHVAKAGEFRRAKLWSVREGSESCEFVSFESLYNPSASKNYEYHAEKAHTHGPEINSTNSQTHTPGESRLTPDQAEKYQRLKAQGMTREEARQAVRDEGES